MKPSRLLTCLILCFVALMGSLMQVRADMVFQDNFSSGNLSKWTISGSPTVVTSPVVSGSSYAVQFPLSSPSLNMTIGNITSSYIQASFVQSNEATLEFYFQTDTLPPLQSGFNLAQIVFNLGGSPNVISLLLSSGKAASSWCFSYPTYQSNGLYGNYGKVIPLNSSDITSVSTGVWYKIDIAIAINGGMGTFQFSINNTPIYIATCDQFNWSPTVFKLGPLISTGFSSGNLYFDGVTVSNTANISQSTTTPSPTFAPTATPEPTIAPTSTSASIQVSAVNDSTIKITTSGNITSSQITSAIIKTDPSVSTTTLSFQLTGQSGTIGFENLTIPKADAPYGKAPTIYIDNQIAENQGYTQDTNSYYVWYSTHFSSHEISIIFSNSNSPPQTIPEFPALLVIIVLLIAVTVLMAMTIKKRKRSG